MGVTHCHRNIAVPHKFLDSQNRYPLRCKPGGESVPQGTKCNFLPSVCHSCIIAQSLDNSLEAVGNRK